MQLTSSRLERKVKKDTCTTSNKEDLGEFQGFQIAISGSLACQDTACNSAQAYGVSVTSTLTVDRSQTVTDTGGYTYTFTTRADVLGVEVTSSHSASYSHSKAITEGTSTAVANGTTYTVTYTIGPNAGSNGFITFTPGYNCYKADVDCTISGKVQGETQCNPVTGGPSDKPFTVGNTRVVYTG
jgi:Tfp pilus assembly protein FimT